jgi:hypothetical protein
MAIFMQREKTRIRNQKIWDMWNNWSIHIMSEYNPYDYIAKEFHLSIAYVRRIICKQIDLDTILRRLDSKSNIGDI